MNTPRLINVFENNFFLRRKILYPQSEVVLENIPTKCTRAKFKSSWKKKKINTLIRVIWTEKIGAKKKNQPIVHADNLTILPIQRFKAKKVLRSTCILNLSYSYKLQHVHSYINSRISSFITFSFQKNKYKNNQKPFKKCTHHLTPKTQILNTVIFKNPSPATLYIISQK